MNKVKVMHTGTVQAYEKYTSFLFLRHQHEAKAVEKMEQLCKYDIFMIKYSLTEIELFLLPSFLHQTQEIFVTQHSTSRFVCLPGFSGQW